MAAAYFHSLGVAFACCRNAYPGAWFTKDFEDAMDPNMVDVQCVRNKSKSAAEAFREDHRHSTTSAHSGQSSPLTVTAAQPVPTNGDSGKNS